VWKVIAQLFAEAIDYIGAPSREELEAIVLRLISAKVRDELNIFTMEQACAYLVRAANTPPAPVHVPDLDLPNDWGIRHAEHGWFAGQGTDGPVWVVDAKRADMYRTLDAAEHGMALHNLRGVAGVSVETLPREE
jgi:hypothetical protein